MFKDIGLSILSWRAPKTVAASLKNYKENDFFDNFAEVFVTFAEVSDEDKAVANKYQVKYKGLEKNYGIRGGMEQAIKNFSTKYVLMVENDCPVIENKEEVKKQLEQGLDALENNVVDVISFRHRFKRGEQWGMEKYSEYYDVNDIHPEFEMFDTFIGGVKPSLYLRVVKFIRRLFRAEKAKRLIGASVFIEKNPEILHPKYIKKYKDLYVIDSSVMPWTNQSVLIKKSFMEELINQAKTVKTKRGVNGMPTLEVELNRKWWRKKHFKIGIGRGFVTHSRLDR